MDDQGNTQQWTFACVKSQKWVKLQDSEGCSWEQEPKIANERIREAKYHLMGMRLPFDAFPR